MPTNYPALRGDKNVWALEVGSVLLPVNSGTEEGGMIFDYSEVDTGV
jgi:hypothetical protein